MFISDEIPKAEKNTTDYLKIRIAIFISGISIFAQLYLFQPLLPELSRYYSITPEQSSLSVSSGTVGMALGLLIFAFVADKIERKKLMIFSILISSFLTIITAFAPDFNILIFINFLKGISLSGVTAVALAYLSEEISVGILGTAIALYLSGNTIGGMSGRVVSLLIAGYKGWHFAVLSIGIVCFLLGLIFAFIMPASKHFIPQKVDFKRTLKLMKIFIKDTYLLSLFLIAFIAMGIFVSVYNYLGFRLEKPPFSFPHQIIAAVFLMYTVGVLGSLLAGKLSNRFSSKKIIWIIVVFMIIGLFLLMSPQTVFLILGLGLVTFSFFAAHTLASRMVSQRAPVGKSTATCIYWLFYYIGSSFFGSFTGKILSDFAWNGFIISLLILAVITLCICLFVNFTKPKNLHLYNIN